MKIITTFTPRAVPPGSETLGWFVIQIGGRSICGESSAAEARILSTRLGEPDPLDVRTAAILAGWDPPEKAAATAEAWARVTAENRFLRAQVEDLKAQNRVLQILHPSPMQSPPGS